MGYIIGIFTPLKIMDEKYDINDISNPIHMFTMVLMMGIWIFGFMWLWLPFQVYNDAKESCKR